MQRLTIIFKSITSVGTTLAKFIQPIIDGITDSDLSSQLKRRTTKYRGTLNRRFKNSRMNKTLKRSRQLKGMSRKDMKSKLKRNATRKMIQTI